MNLYDLASAELKHVKTLLLKAEKAVNEAPEGEIFAHRNGGYWRYKIRKENQVRSLRKEEKELKEALAIKAFNEALVRDLMTEREAIESYLRIRSGDSLNGMSFLNENPGIFTLIQHRYKSKKTAAAEWENSQFPSHAGHPENLRFKTVKGHMVRSKSEMLFSNQFFMNEIPYRYECDLKFEDGTIVCPDFLLLNPDTGVIIPHEHLGLIDQDGYRGANADKIYAYAKNGFFPGLNFIVTYETEHQVFDTSQMSETIELFWKISAVRLPWHKLIL